MAVRLRFAVKDLKYPVACPNCLSTPAENLVVISRDSGMLAVWAKWPHCSRCAEDDVWKRRRSSALKWTIVGSVLLSAISVMIYFQGGILSDAVSLGLAGLGVVLLPVGPLIYASSVRKRPRPEGAVTVGSGVRIIRGGSNLLGKNIMEVVFLNERYADQFKELNGL
ncbi:MAG: hypothetical protein ACYTAF_05745 [Planctomycetota bacterium]|jgi:hypothetical protein